MMVWARRPLVAGNWKMNGLRSSAAELSRIIQGAKELGAVDLMLCPPATLIALFAAAVAGSAVRIGAQDCHAEPSGAFTGDLSAEMLRDAGASAIIVGHSERRIHHNETDADVRAKALAARRAGLCAIICVGETRGERVPLLRIELKVERLLPWRAVASAEAAKTMARTVAEGANIRRQSRHLLPTRWDNAFHQRR